MVKNEVQEGRMRKYFIDAAAELLKGEGLKSISTRNVAERAGYSYATLYNYFKDIKALVFECVKVFSEEIYEDVQVRTKKVHHGMEGIKARTKAYVQYFIQYPGIFELFFLEKPNDLGSKQSLVNLIWSLPDRICEKDWEAMRESGQWTEQELRDKSDAIKYEVSGLLLFYLNRGKPSRYDGFMELVDTRISKIMLGH